MTKTELRTYCKSKRKVQPNIALNLLENYKIYSAFKNCDTLLCYYPIGSEADILPIIQYATSNGKRIALPRCVSKTDIEFYFVNRLGGLTKGSFGIPEPSEKCIKLTPEYTQAHNCMTLVPGLCFDRRGYRLGYGLGYYDRFLPTIKSQNIGVCHSELFFDKIPSEPFDIKTDFILTEKGVSEANEI